jgi:hypothetical protein
MMMWKSALLMLAFAAPAVAQTEPRPLREAAHLAAVSQLQTQTEPLASITQQPQQPRGWVQRHPVLTGTIAGASIGASVGALTCPSPTAEGGYPCEDYTHSADVRGVGALYYGAWGAGIGALVGLVVHAVTR